MKPFRRKTNQKGFTMTELMVVVVIVGILAAIAVPIYSRYVRNARVTEATARIGEIVTGCKAYAQEHPNDTSGNPQWPTQAQAEANDSIIDITTMTENVGNITLQGGGDATVDDLVIIVTGTNKLNGITVTATVPDINSNAVIKVEGL